MARRHYDAVMIQQGACNPSGILHSMLDACKEIYEEQGQGYSTDDLCHDPALQLMCHQLAHVLFMYCEFRPDSGGSSYNEWDRAYEECKRMAGDMLPEYLRPAEAKEGGESHS